MFTKKLLYDIFNYEPMGSRPAEVRKVVERADASKYPKIIDDQTHIGLEIEVERIRDRSFDNQVFWRVVEDGSLRNNGWEFVSIPLKGVAIPLALTQLQEFFTNWNPQYEFSDRTSVHVHMNVRDLTVEQLCNLLLLYLVFEPVLYKYVFDTCKRDRETNIFCVPLADTINYLGIGDVLDFMRREQSPDTIGMFLHQWKKYSGLNLAPVRRLGTVEFRHMGGMLDVTYLCQWVNLCLALKRAAQRKSFDTLKNEIIELNTSSQYHLFLTRVFDEMSILLNRYNLREELEKGVVSVKKGLTGSKTSWRNELISTPYEEMETKFLNNSSLKNLFERFGYSFSVKDKAKNRSEIQARLGDAQKAYAIASAEFERAHVAVRRANEAHLLADTAEQNYLNEHDGRFDENDPEALRLRAAVQAAVDESNRLRRIRDRLERESATLATKIKELSKMLTDDAKKKKSIYSQEFTWNTTEVNLNDVVVRDARPLGWEVRPVAVREVGVPEPQANPQARRVTPRRNGR